MAFAAHHAGTFLAVPRPAAHDGADARALAFCSSVRSSKPMPSSLSRILHLCNILRNHSTIRPGNLSHPFRAPARRQEREALARHCYRNELTKREAGFLAQKEGRVASVEVKAGSPAAP